MRFSALLQTPPHLLWLELSTSSDTDELNVIFIMIITMYFNELYEFINTSVWMCKCIDCYYAVMCVLSVLIDVVNERRNLARNLTCKIEINDGLSTSSTDAS